jgi:hypothetical protein
MEAERRRGGAGAEASDFLRSELGDGARSVKDIEEKAEAFGISKATLKRARKKLGVNAFKNGLGDGWSLQLPERRLPYKDN